MQPKKEQQVPPLVGWETQLAVQPRSVLLLELLLPPRLEMFQLQSASRIVVLSYLRPCLRLCPIAPLLHLLLLLLLDYLGHL